MVIVKDNRWIEVKKLNHPSQHPTNFLKSLGKDAIKWNFPVLEGQF